MKTSKRIGQGIFFACLLLFCVSVKQEQVEAKYLKADKTYSCDLNGDGRKEQIKYRCTGEAYEDYTVHIYINGKKVLKRTNSRAIWASIYILDVNKKNKQKELYLQWGSDSDCFEGGIGFHYKNKKLKKYFTFSTKDSSSGRIGPSSKQPGDGKLYFDGEYSHRYFMQGYVKQAYVIKNGKLKLAKQSVLKKLSPKDRYRTTRTMRVYTTSACKKTKFSLEAYEEFTVLKMKVNQNGKKLWKEKYLNAIYIKTSSGKKGWIKLPNSSFCEGYNEWSGWSEYAYTWG